MGWKPDSTIAETYKFTNPFQLATSKRRRSRAERTVITNLSVGFDLSVLIYRLKADLEGREATRKEEGWVIQPM